MTFTDWLKDTHSRFVRDPPARAAKGAGLAFWYGAVRRAASTTGLGPDPTVVWERDDWDVICVLDACRLDLLLEVAWDDTVDWLPESPGSITSAGSMSAEWINNTFAPAYSDELKRTAYITGNPFTGKDLGEWQNLPLSESDLGYLDEAWRTDWADYYGEGDISTIPPRPLTDRAIDCWRRRDELGVDQMIIHYMQPHAPFRDLPEVFGPERELNEWGKPMPGGRTKSVWKKLRDGEVERDAVWDAYRDNLEWVLEDVALLKENCDARIALTADHGNAMGEWAHWGHPGGSPVPALREVPWTTVDGVDTQGYDPEIAADTEQTELADGDIEARLSALGYA